MAIWMRHLELYVVLSSSSLHSSSSQIWANRVAVAPQGLQILRFAAVQHSRLSVCAYGSFPLWFLSLSHASLSPLPPVFSHDIKYLFIRKKHHAPRFPEKRFNTAIFSQPFSFLPQFSPPPPPTLEKSLIIIPNLSIIWLKV